VALASPEPPTGSGLGYSIFGSDSVSTQFRDVLSRSAHSGFYIGMSDRSNKSAAANGLSAVRSSVAEVGQRTVRSTGAAEAVAELLR
jgi:hypothetical protein